VKYRASLSYFVVPDATPFCQFLAFLLERFQFCPDWGATLLFERQALSPIDPTSTASVGDLIEKNARLDLLFFPLVHPIALAGCVRMDIDVYGRVANQIRQFWELVPGTYTVDDLIQLAWKKGWFLQRPWDSDRLVCLAVQLDENRLPCSMLAGPTQSRDLHNPIRLEYRWMRQS
jgi:hypothetical protein